MNKCEEEILNIIIKKLEKCINKAENNIKGEFKSFSGLE